MKSDTFHCIRNFFTKSHNNLYQTEGENQPSKTQHKHLKPPN